MKSWILIRRLQISPKCYVYNDIKYLCFLLTLQLQNFFVITVIRISISFTNQISSKMIDNGYSNVPKQIETFDFSCQTIKYRAHQARVGPLRSTIRSHIWTRKTSTWSYSVGDQFIVHSLFIGDSPLQFVYYLQTAVKVLTSVFRFR